MSAPCKRKGITIASGLLHQGRLHLHSLDCLHDFAVFEAWLRRPGPWLAAFDFPFSLPRELVETLNWPTVRRELMSHVASLSREDLRLTFNSFCAARPVGRKFAHRARDGIRSNASRPQLTS